MGFFIFAGRTGFCRPLLRGGESIMLCCCCTIISVNIHVVVVCIVLEELSSGKT